MRTILPLLLCGLLPVFAAAADEADALQDLAATKREAAVIMKVKSRNISSYGAFISKDGLALVDMACLALTRRDFAGPGRFAINREGTMNCCRAHQRNLPR